MPRARASYLCVFALTLAAAAPAGAARVESFSPEGVAKNVRQVAVRFSEAMVPLGDPRSAQDPFAIDCAPKGASRWADGRTWVYTFDADLPAGVECAFTLREGAKALSGAALAGKRVFRFSTGGPAIVAILPDEDPIAEDQRFAVKLDGEASRASIERHAFVRALGLADPIGLRVVEGAERDDVLKSEDWATDDPRLLVLEARQRFAPGAKLVLHWGPGIAAASGVATTEDQSYEYAVRPRFGARLACERVKADADCVPLSPVRLVFTSPVAWETAQQIVLRAGETSYPAHRRWADDHDPWVDAIEFHGPFPPRAVLRAELPAGLSDDAGRTLALEAPLELKTDGYPSLAKFGGRFGIVESAEPVLPVTVRRLEAGAALRTQAVTGTLAARTAAVKNEPRAILAWLSALAQARDEASVFGQEGLRGAPQEMALPRALGDEETEVVGLPLGEPGLHVVEIESRVLGEAILDPPAPMYVAAGALVTNLAVHFKWGQDASLVWVTSLDRGEPVPGAHVRVADCRGEVLADATSDAQGVAEVAGLPHERDLASCNDHGYSDYGSGLLVLAELGDDLGLAHTSWNEGIEPWRFGVETEWTPRSLRAATIFDRTLLRAGETVHMKHILRRPVLAGFAQVPQAERPVLLRIQHLGSDDAWDLPVDFRPDGSAETDWAIPKQAKLGSYEVKLYQPGKSVWEAETTGGFRVDAFRVPLARGVVRPPDDALVAPSRFAVDVAVQYLSGGGAGDLPVVVRSQLRSREAPTFDDFPGYEFARGGLKEGVRTRRFGEGELDFEREWEWGESGALGVVWRVPKEAGARGPVATQELTLDDAGTGRAIVADLPRADAPLEVQTELEFRDPNGAVQTSARTIPIWPSSRVVGIRSASVRPARDAVTIETAVVDLAGKPVWLAGVAIDAYEKRTYSARKRVVGGFYAYEDVEEVRRIGRFCSGRTDRRGHFECESAPPAQGDLVFVARSADWRGRESVTRTSVYVPGDGEEWFAQGDGDRMDLVPERPRYEPGDVARFQVRMPFRAATALVTLEREGVARHFVTKLSGARASVEVPIEGGDAPNVFVSVLAVRGRVEAPPPSATADLGKPAYRIGLAELRVGWSANELQVRVAPERSVFHVRDKALVRISVRDARGAPPPPGSEVALAAVDEGLLELMPNTSWKLLDAMMAKRAYEVKTSTAQLQVVGKRHYGKKAIPSGGGGGERATRELFDTLLLWQPRVALDAAGDAVAWVPLNDSLTSFRIAAVATGGDAQFGTGEATIRSTQDLMILAGLPQVVRTGDRFPAGFTIRNTTAAAQSLTLTPHVEGLAAPLAPIALELGAGQAREVSWDVEVPSGVSALPFEVEAAAVAGTHDRMKTSVRVVPAVPERVLQATLVQVRGPQSIPVERPADALPDRGKLAVALRPRLADGRDAIDRAMRAYPYHCLEQRASIAVALRDADAWAGVAEDLPAYLDSEGFARFFPTSAGEGSEVLTSYLLALSNEAGLELPAGSRDRMLGALANFVDGSATRREVVRAADLPLRKLAALEALARYGKATPEQVGALRVDARLLPDSGLLDWLGILDRVPGAPQRDARRAEADRLLRARLDVQGTTLGFASSRGGALDWLLATSDVNAARLVLSRLAAPGWSEDAPKLVRAALAFQRGGAWPTTMANAWGVLALDAFSKRYEKVAVAGTTEVSVASADERLVWKEAPQGGELGLPWPPARAPLALRHAGAGAPWALVQSIAAVPLRAPIASGYRIVRSVEPVSQKTPGVWTRGDVARVRVEIESDAESSWVVASDPIPAGASLLGTGLGNDSALLTQGERDHGFAFEAFTERSQEGFRRYYEWVPKGRFSYEYTVRLGQSGTFQLPPSRVEAMYSPEHMGELPIPPLEVNP